MKFLLCFVCMVFRRKDKFKKHLAMKIKPKKDQRYSFSMSLDKINATVLAYLDSIHQMSL